MTIEGAIAELQNLIKADDGDEFKSWVDDWYDCTDIGNIVESWIDERPTILEAEE